MEHKYCCDARPGKDAGQGERLRIQMIFLCSGRALTRDFGIQAVKSRIVVEAATDEYLFDGHTVSDQRSCKGDAFVVDVFFYADPHGIFEGVAKMRLGNKEFTGDRIQG